MEVASSQLRASASTGRAETAWYIAGDAAESIDRALKIIAELRQIVTLDVASDVPLGNEGELPLESPIRTAPPPVDAYDHSLGGPLVSSATLLSVDSFGGSANMVGTTGSMPELLGGMMSMGPPSSESWDSRKHEEFSGVPARRAPSPPRLRRLFGGRS